MIKPVVSVICLTYNHEKYIHDTIDSILNQKTNFHFEFIIHDDASTDNTASIIKSYETKKYDNVTFRPFYQQVNKWNPKTGYITNYVFNKVQGKYIAMCEGDDYWVDSYKLQKQVDLLETTDYSMCFNRAIVIDENNNFIRYRNYVKKNKVFTIQNLIKNNIISTASVMYKCNVAKKLFKLAADNKCLDNMYMGDWILNLTCALNGHIFYFSDIMSVYRIHNEGLWSKLSQTEKYTKSINVLNYFNTLTNYKYNEYVLESIKDKKQKLFAI